MNKLFSGSAMVIAAEREDVAIETAIYRNIMEVALNNLFCEWIIAQSDVAILPSNIQWVWPADGIVKDCALRVTRDEAAE